ncbi:ATP-binding SpoIIE family protein phosphatase [Streptomyces sp. NBC_01320]|uniref:ATP-binding SpoIIE family protein phosphatase n=1 Tax=Streptomyces sp. NBC_01320 TaxID=2903824 RepID=UPI002E13BBD6|nr:SpoIIE family protein phosphatase [Streptomyces sp. NBC_01320]
MNDRLALLNSVERGVTEGEVLRLALQHAVAELDGLGGTVHLCGPMSALRLVSVAGLPPGLVRPWEIIDQEDTAAPARAVRQGTGVWTLHDLSGTTPPTSTDGWPGTGLAAVPVFGRERPVGALTVVTGASGEPTRKQWEFLTAVATWAKERMIQAPPPARPAREEPSGNFLRQETAATERASRITELTAALAKATTSRDVVDAVAQRALPPFRATGLLVHAIEGDRVHNVGAVGYPRTFLERVDGRSRIATDPVWDAISTQRPLFVSSAQEYAARYPDLAHNPHDIDKQAWAFLPLTASGHTFGVCVIAFDQPRRLADEERTLLTAISALVAQALERARLYDAEHTRSQELQRALLPQRLPDLPACTTAARYLPAGQGMDVGGDWYDVIPLPAGRVALVVGDVVGHGLSEAVTMGRLRTAVHTLAGFELPPDEIMSHLNDIVSGLGKNSYATCLYALYDSTTGTCSLTRAGHPPPAVLHPDGTVHYPHPVPDPPLGAAEPPFETVELTMPPGSLLVLYTDGLVESSEREIDQGMTELANLLRTRDSEDLDRLCETLIAGLLPAGQHTSDDAALLVARVHALSSDQMASWPLPEDPRAAGLARRHVREQLSTWGLDDMATTTELLASELVGNVVRHGRGPLQLRLLRGAELVCEVSDGSLTMPRVRHASETDEGGRGLQLVAALSQRWGTRYTATGKCIWTAQPMHGSDIPAPLLRES